MTSNSFKAVLALWGALLLSGCQSIPDMAAWDQSTKDLSSAVVVGFKTAATVNRDMANRLEVLARTEPVLKEPASRYADAATSIDANGEKYGKLFGAIADYSTSLAAISRASSSSQKTVDAVAGSVNQLVTVLGATPLAGAGFELGKLLAGEVIKIKAARDFSDAVSKADPVIGQICTLLLADLVDLQKTVAPSKVEAITAAIQQPLKERVEYRQALLRRQKELQKAVTGKLWPEPKAGEKRRTASLLSISDAQELAKVEQYLRDTDHWYLPMQSDLSSALKQHFNTGQLLIETGRGIEAWRASHASLAVAAAEQRVPESARLAALALRIRELVTEMKKEK